MTANIGASIAVSHVAFPMSAFKQAPKVFHMTTTTVMPHIVVSGFIRGDRVGSMHGLYPQWDTSSMNMQIWGAGHNHNILIVFGARRIYYHMGWRGSDPGIWLSEVGACIPDTLSSHIFCKRVVTLVVHHVIFVLQSARQGYMDIAMSCKCTKSYMTPQPSLEHALSADF